MAVPMKKISKSRKGSRRAHDRLKEFSLAICPQCSEPKRPHHACPKCGHYKGREVISVTTE